jgi:hypothetical protein
MSYRVPHSSELFRTPLLQQLTTQVHYLAKLNAIVAELLPAMKGQCHISSYVNGVLTFQTHNQALLGQLRYLQTHYSQKLRQHKAFSQLIRLQFLYDEQAIVAKAQHEPAKPLSDQTKKLLLETAAAIGDAQLSEALRHLAR